MSRTSLRAAARLSLAVLVLSLFATVAAMAQDEYVVPRTPTADRDRGSLRYIDNFFSGISGAADNIFDIVAAAGGLTMHTAGRIALLVSDVGGFVDDNALTRTFFHGAASTHLAEVGLWASILGTQMIETSHGLNIDGWPPRRAIYLNADDGGEGFNYIDYIHCKDGYESLACLPLEILAFLLADGVVRPMGNVLRLVSLDESDQLEEWSLDLVERAICAPEGGPVNVREVPVQTEVIREVFRTVTTMDFTFRDVLFALDSAELTPMGDRVCDGIIEALAGQNVTGIEVTGHTCDRGVDEYNQALGQRRADTVATALAARGLNRGTMSVTSRGEGEPVVPNENETMRSLNRRVEVRVTYVTEE